MEYAIALLISALLAIAPGYGTRLATGDVFRAQRWLFGVIRDFTFFFPFLLPAGSIEPHADKTVHRRYTHVWQRVDEE
jgi:hypothetical protein